MGSNSLERQLSVDNPVYLNKLSVFGWSNPVHRAALCSWKPYSNQIRIWLGSTDVAQIMSHKLKKKKKLF